MVSFCGGAALGGKKQGRALQPATEFPPEDRAAEAVTIGWTLCTLFTMCAELVGLIAKVAISSAVGESQLGWHMLVGITLVLGLASGTLGLVLTPLVYRLRRTPPPAAVTALAVIVGSTPLLLAALRWWLSL